MPSQVLKLKTEAAVRVAVKKYTLMEIVEMLESKNILLLGSLKKESKKVILTKSLRAADPENVKSFVEQILVDKPPKKADSLKFDLHPSFLGTKVEKFLRSGDFEEAVRVAFLRINKRVKKISGLSADGAALMRSAFSKNGPKIKINPLVSQEELDEQEGMMHIFEGSMLAFRNPQSHDDEKTITPEEASRILSLANYLMTILDNADALNQ